MGAASGSEGRPVTDVGARPVSSHSESERFGLRVGRATASVGERSAEVLEVARAAVLAGQYDLVIVRAPDVIRPDEFGPDWSNAVEVIDAGCAVTYEGDVDPSRIAGPATNEVVRLRRVTAWGTQETEIVQEIFAGYRNHIAANPRLDHSLVAAGYADWSERHVDGRVPGDCYVLEDATGRPLAFAAVAPTEDALIVDLAGVLPAHRGRGVYQRLLHLIEVEAARLSFTKVRISTQVETTGAIRAWERRGWREIERERTAHVMLGRDGRI